MAIVVVIVVIIVVVVVVWLLIDASVVVDELIGNVVVALLFNNCDDENKLFVDCNNEFGNEDDKGFCDETLGRIANDDAGVIVGFVVLRRVVVDVEFELEFNVDKDVVEWRTFGLTGRSAMIGRILCSSWGSHIDERSTNQDKSPVELQIKFA